MISITFVVIKFNKMEINTAETLTEPKILGQLPENELQLFRMSLNETNRLNMALGEIELEKYRILKEIDEAKYSLKVEANKIIKRFGAGSVIDIRTGQIIEGKKPN